MELVAKSVPDAEITSGEALRTVLETALDAVVVMDAEGAVVDWNRMAEATFGWTSSEAVGQLMADLIIPPRYREAHNRGLAHYLDTGQGPILRQRIEITALHKSGREFPIELSVTPTDLSRDSLVFQRIAISLHVQVGDSAVDGGIEGFGVGEGLVGEVMGFEVMPDDFDVIEFGGIFRQPLDGEPVGARRERRHRRLADMDRAVVENDDDGLDRHADLGAAQKIEGVQQRDEIGAALGAGGGDDELAARPIERAHHGDLPGLSGRRHAKVGPTLCPGASEIGMRQRLALVGEQENDIAGRGLRLAQLQPQADTIDLVGDLPAFQRVPRPSEAEPPFLRSTLESCEREIETPSRDRISSVKRASVQFVRSATGAESKGPATLSAASALNGAGPGATLAFSASTPPLVKSPRHSRTVSSRTPNASAIRALVQPLSVSTMARARSASARSVPPAIDFSAAFCSSDAVTGDLPAMPRPRESMQGRNHTQSPLAMPNKPA